jgi:diguanylate cyclase (GGDEF)-like protein
MSLSFSEVVLKPHPMSGIGKEVLVIEDHSTLANLLAGLMHERIGCDVQAANTLAEAVAKIKANPDGFAIAICDLLLPDAQFDEIINTVRSYGIAVVAMTGEFSADFREVILKKDVVDYVLKDSPNALNYIIDLVHRLYKNTSLKALVVDDSAASRSLLKHNLKMQNLQVFLAEDGRQALTILHANPDISLIITDYEMPGMNGIMLCNEVRKHFSKEQLSIIGISGLAKGQLSAEFLKSGANDFIVKPFSYEELLCRVNQNLDMLDLIRDNRAAATRDFLTGLFNRRYFFQYGQKMVRKIRENRGDVTVAMIDIDHFKDINDKHGHDIGDVALIQVAQSLQFHFGGEGLARLGGEEFAVLISGQSLANVRQLLEGYRLYQERHPLRTLDGQSEPLEISIGCASLSDGYTDLMELLKKADQNLYAAKHQGRNRLVMS